MKQPLQQTLCLQASDLKSLNTSNAKLKLPDGRTLKIVKYVAPNDKPQVKSMTVVNDTYLKSSEAAAQAVSAIKPEDKKPKKYSLSLKRSRKAETEADGSSQWLQSPGRDTTKENLQIQILGKSSRAATGQKVGCGKSS